MDYVSRLVQQAGVAVLPRAPIAGMEGTGAPTAIGIDEVHEERVVTVPPSIERTAPHQRPELPGDTLSPAQESSRTDSPDVPAVPPTTAQRARSGAPLPNNPASQPASEPRAFTTPSQTRHAQFDDDQEPTPQEGEQLDREVLLQRVLTWVSANDTAPPETNTIPEPERVRPAEASSPTDESRLVEKVEPAVLRIGAEATEPEGARTPPLPTRSRGADSVEALETVEAAVAQTTATSQPQVPRTEVTIGALNITVESPPSPTRERMPEIVASPPPSPPPAAPPPPPSLGDRLRRRYIRM